MKREGHFRGDKYVEPPDPTPKENALINGGTYIERRPGPHGFRYVVIRVVMEDVIHGSTRPGYGGWRLKKPVSTQLTGPLTKKQAEEFLAALPFVEADAKKEREEKTGLEVKEKKYLPWTEAGGPNECPHGRAEGIPCPHCDEKEDLEKIP